MAPAPSPKTESGLEKLNALLESKSYLGGTPKASAEDISVYSQMQRVPDQKQYPHLHRWYQHLTGLRARYAHGQLPWLAEGASVGDSAAKKGRAPGKEKVQLTVDCVAKPVSDRHNPAPQDPPLGAAGTCFAGAEKAGRGTYYITTAINYSNGWPHIGHAYEALVSDAFARYHRINGEDVFFQTGTDEHGQKIAQGAEDKNMTPQQMCDMYEGGFKALNQRLAISQDFFVRTTADRHKKVAQEMWKKCKAVGDIYLDRYEGWYLVREERFITDTEAQEWDFKDPISGVPLKKMSEPSFFFKLSKYADRVLKHIEDNEMFIQPQGYRTEIIERLKGMEMRDLSISRGTFEWGVPCPEDPVDGKPHVMYVWFDALCNYISGVDGLDKNKPLSRFWPCQMHVVGKDIHWFHTVIWPAMLMSAGVPLPKSVVVHGFISGADGRKMSKSLGNVVDPHEMLDILPCDTLRWYFCRESSYGDDVKFSVDSLRLMHNSELCDNLGNLVNRAVNLAGGSVPDGDVKLVSRPFDLKELKVQAKTAYNEYRLHEGAELAIRACAATNKWIADLEPWKMKDEDKQPLRRACLRVLLESVYVLAHFFAPFIPLAADAIFKKIGAPPRPIPDLKDDFANLKPGDAVVTGSILFEQLEVKPAGEASPAAAKAEAKKEAKKDGQKAEGKAKAKAGGKKAPVEEDNPDQPLFSKLDIRVGKVVKAWHHPEADRLFVEEIDVGDPDGPRQVISGLREHYTVEQFTGKKLLAVCNLMGAKMKGITSHGMVLCAKNPDKKVVELISVPDDLPVGTRVLPEGVPFSWAPFSNKAVDKYKIWDQVAKELRTAKDKTAVFAGKPLVTEKGVKFQAPTCSETIIS